MKITQFRATRVYGYQDLNFKLEFKSDVTFLIGINGSGKTTALRLILGLMSPSYMHLNQIIYEYIELLFLDDNNNDIKIFSKSSPNKGLLIGYSDKDTPQPITEEFSRIGDKEPFSEEFYERYMPHIRRFENSKVVQKIRKIATPIFLGLNRRIFEEKDEFLYRQNNLFFHTKRSLKDSQEDAISKSLTDIQELIFTYMRQIPVKQNSLSEKFKQKLFALSFEFIEPQQIDLSGLNNLSSTLLDTKNQLNNAIQDLGISDMSEITKSINDFFTKIESVSNNLANLLKKNNGTLSRESIPYLNKYAFNNGQLQKINSIIALSKQYQDEIQKLEEPISRLKKIISNFFNESGKELIVEGDGVLKIKKQDKKASIFELSSGEKQIIAMIAHLIFYESEKTKTSGVFIIDEPELSLHLAWQEIFVQSIITASPSTQFILATHSPAIISNPTYENNCQDLTKSN